ncbi:EamA family transporter [Vulgatibacter sp.]|uniref:EamA family transporter n=1 Tax=Vulgatibacter sp. TaxID=1971226 RepID=UPI0035681367
MVRYVLLVTLGACSYGVLSTIVKRAYDEGFGVEQVVGSQMLFGFGIVALLAAIFARGRGGARPGQWLPLLAVGVPIGLTGVLYYSALLYVSASLAVVLLFQFTWMGVLLEAVVDRKPPAPLRIAAVGLLLAGTALASGLLEETGGTASLRGIFLGLASAVSYTAFIYGSGRVEAQVQPWLRSLVMVGGSVLLAFVVFPPRFLVDGSLPAGLWKHGLLLALFGPVLPTVCFNLGVPRIGPGLASILGAAELPIAVLLSTAILGERVGPLQWVGIAVLLVGIVLPELRLPQQRQHRVDGSG